MTQAPAETAVSTLKTFDIAILGTGMAGTILAAILARHNLRVAMVDPGNHPRFSIGETSAPYGSLLLEMLAARFDVPQLYALTCPSNVRRNISTNHGILKGYGCVYHREGQPIQPHENFQVTFPSFIFEAENHFFRQDVDAYLLHVAIHYGAQEYQRVAVSDVAIDGDGVTLLTAAGPLLRARYVVDTIGPRSLLAEKFGLRQQPTRLKSQTRALYTHMVGVKPFDQSVGRSLGNPAPWHEGALLHMFEGGWLWVTPFDNHPESRNPLASVGLMLDPRRFPADGTPPEQEFAQIVARFPDIAPQFAQARPVRNWTATERQQYSSSACVGQRFCLIDQAAGFIDPMFGTRMIGTFRVVNVLALELLRAVAENNFAPERFAQVEQIQQGSVDYGDDIISTGQLASGDPGLAYTWFKLMLISEGFGEMLLIPALHEYRQTRDQRAFANLDRPLDPKVLLPTPEYVEIWARLIAEFEDVGAGRRPAAELPGRLGTYLKETGYIPPFHEFENLAKQYYGVKPSDVPGIVRWIATSPSSDFMKLHARTMRAILSKVLRRKTLKTPFDLHNPAVHRNALRRRAAPKTTPATEVVGSIR